MKQAILELKKAIELRPLEVDAHYNLGAMYQRVGYYSGAATHLETVVSLQPGHPYADRSLADVRTSFQETGDQVGAEAIPRTPFEAAGDAESRGDLRAARDCYEEAIRDDPHHAAAYSQLGATYFEQGDYKVAVRLFERGLRYKSDHFVLNNNAAGAHYRLGNIDEAVRYWRECLKIEPGNEDVIRQIGIARSAR